MVDSFEKANDGTNGHGPKKQIILNAFVIITLGSYDGYKGPANVVPPLASGAQFPVNDPLYLVPALPA